MKTIHFATLENTVGMFGNSQVGVYVDGVLKFYMAKSEYIIPGVSDIRLFTVPENVQLIDFQRKYQSSSFTELQRIIKDRYNELEEGVKETERFWIKAELKSGLHVSLSKDHAEWDIYAFTDSTFSPHGYSRENIDTLIEKIKEDPERVQDINRVFVISKLDFQTVTIYSAPELA